MQGKKMATAAAVAGMSARSGHNWREGKLPSDSKRQDRHWRTHPDPFGGVWEEEVVPLLQSDRNGVLQATTILERLCGKYPDRFSSAQLRTLQRRVRDWRALSGPDREVFFPQVHPPGREAQLDFTSASKLEVTIAGTPFPHLLFEFVLSHSGWRYVELSSTESFMSLKSGLQHALCELGGTPQIIRSDNLSAVTHELRKTGGRTLNRTYRQLLEHYGLKSTRTNPRKAHENGVVEQAHRRMKNLLRQELLLRGSSDFYCVGDYRDFVLAIVNKKNRAAAARTEIERSHLRPLPPTPLPDYVTYQARVRKWSTIRVSNRTYTVPPRLIGQKVEARLYPEHLDVYYKGSFIERIERVSGARRARVNYRHVIASLVRKPGAFARYRWRDQLFPTLTFRRAYDALLGWRGRHSADVNYLRILQLAATTMEADVARALAGLLDKGERFDCQDVRDERAGRAALAVDTRAGIPGHTRPGNLRPSAYRGPAMTAPSVAARQIKLMCKELRLPTIGEEAVERFVNAGHVDALDTLLAVFCQEMDDRRQRRVDRLRKSSKLPPGKTWDNFDRQNLPPPLSAQLQDLLEGQFLDGAVNVLAFGLPGTGKTHALCAIGHKLVENGRSVLFAPAYRLVQELLAAKRDLELPRLLRKLDYIDLIIIDDLGYLPQGTDEAEVLFTLIAERYERRSIGITSNLVFSEWGKIFPNPMATAAAADRIVHHAVVLEFDVPSYRTGLEKEEIIREKTLQK